jgi:hypothetical protein
VDEQEIVRRLLEGAGPRPPIPEEDLAAISAAARSAWQAQVQRHKTRRPFGPPAFKLAAALAVSLGLVWWWASHRDRDLPTVAWVEQVAGSVRAERPAQAPRPILKGDALPLGAVVLTGGDGTEGRAALRLPGGAVVRLDEETRLRLVSAAVLELERGGVYVDTAGTAAAAAISAIEVRTPLGTVRDVGTQFAVRLVGAGRPALLVRVRDGAVRTENQGRSYLTEVGQELVLRRDGTSEHRAAAGYGPGWDWILGVSPSFDIEGRSLQDFLGWVSRETGWRIAFDSGLAGSASQIVLHGSLGGLRPDQAPFVVLPGAGLEGKLQGGTLIVRRPS